MKKLITIILFFVSLICSATNYYVKNTGSDAANGLTPATAWATVTKVNASTFQPGDTIFFNRGDTWRTQVNLPSSGNAGAYIVITNYGTGDLPKFLGSTEITTWDDGAEVAANNDLLSESFEGAGYEHVWDESLGANESNIVDEDNVDVARPTGGGAQVLKIVKDITPTGTAAASAARANHDLGSVKPVVYCDFYLMINAHGLASGEDLWVFRADESSFNTALQVSLKNVAGDIKFICQAWNEGALTQSSYATYPAAGSITLDQWYHFQLRYDVTNTYYSFAIDGNYVYSGSLTSSYRTGVQLIRCGDSWNVRTLTAYYDLINVSSTNFYRADLNLRSNVYLSTTSVTDPYALQYDGNIYFKELDGDISWGRVKKADTSALAVEYDWVWIGDHIYIYSPTNPDTRYDGVEVAQRTKCFSINNKDYITIDGIETAFSGSWGICDLMSPTTLTGLIIKNCESHHIGIKASVAGYGIEAWHSNMHIHNNYLHDAGRRNISINLYTGAITQSNVIIENNVLYHGFHTTGVDMSSEGTGNYDSIIIRNNLIYDEITEILDNLESYQSQSTWISNEGTGTFRKIYIYNNFYRNITTYAIAVRYDVEVFIYNNTFYGFNPNIGANRSLILIGSGTDAVIKNNIFYNNIPNTNNAACMEVNAAATAVSDYNLFYCTDALSHLLNWKGTTYYTSTWATYKAASGQDANSPAPADPLVKSFSDFGLNIGSPAIGAGVNLSLETDYTGNPWSNPPSLGALEFGSTNAVLLRSGTKLLRTSGSKLIRQ